MSIQNELPAKFCENMMRQLQDEADQFFASYAHPIKHGIKVNTLKVTPNELFERFPIVEKEVAWAKEGYYLKDQVKPGNDPYAYASLFYQQEPSAMITSSVADVRPFDRVADLCAAPGGKSIGLACKLKNTGVLVSNDISISRSRVLLHNIESFGIGNAMVFVEDAKKLAAFFPAYFDTVVVDAPCSGEGMFRKDRRLIEDWTKKGPVYYSEIQKELLHQAYAMLKEGGQIVYSTCTFSGMEDEDVVEDFLLRHEDMEEEPIAYPHFVKVKHGYKLYPHRIEGEGHYVCTLRKKGNKIPNEPAPLIHFQTDDISYSAYGYLKTYQNQSFVTPTNQTFPKLRLLRNGLYLGEKKHHFIPSQALSRVEPNCRKIHLSHDDIRVKKYLKGETIQVDNEGKGYVQVCVENYGLGFAKQQATTLKNMLDRGYIVF